MAIPMKSPPFGGRGKSYYRPKGTASDFIGDASKALGNLSIYGPVANKSFMRMRAPRAAYLGP